MQKDNQHITQWIRNSAKATMRVKQVTRRPFEPSDETEANVVEKTQQIIHGKAEEEIKPVRKAVTKSVRKDRRRHRAEMVDKDLDIRDQYMGLTYLRQAFVPIPLGMKDSKGKHVPFRRKSRCISGYLTQQIWRKTEQTPAPTDKSGYSKIITEELGIPTTDITMEEIVWAVKKLKRGKAPGPDGVPIELYKEMNTD